MSEEKSSYPLQWPLGWKRTTSANRKNAQFRKHGKYVTIYEGAGRVVSELEKMGIRQYDVIISTNVRPRLDGLPRSDERVPADPGAVAYWRTRGDKIMKCMAVDRYTTVADNLAAIAATLEAMRAIERHGGSEIQERAFTGFTALPEKATSAWRDVLQYSKERPERDEIEKQFRIQAQRHHPDTGGDRDEFEKVVQARKDALAELVIA